MIEPTRNDAYISYERLLDDWWDTHKGDVYLREDPVAVEEEEEVEIQTLVPQEPDPEELQFDDEESSAIFVPDEEEVMESPQDSGDRFYPPRRNQGESVRERNARLYGEDKTEFSPGVRLVPNQPDPEEEGPAPRSVTYGQGVTTLKQLSADMQSVQVKRRSDNAYTGALIALTDYAEEFNKYGDLYDVDPLLIASIAGYESGGNPDAVGPTNDVGLMQFTPRTWQEIMPGRSLDERIDPVLSIEAAAKLLDRERKALESIDLAVLAYNVGVPRVGQIIRGESEFPGISNFYYPVVNLTYERLRDSLSSAGSQQ